jgi:hypothetical protein
MASSSTPADSSSSSSTDVGYWIAYKCVRNEMDARHDVKFSYGGTSKEAALDKMIDDIRNDWTPGMDEAFLLKDEASKQKVRQKVHEHGYYFAWEWKRKCSHDLWYVIEGSSTSFKDDHMVHKTMEEYDVIEEEELDA